MEATFPNCCDDVCFGGKKRLCKIEFTNSLNIIRVHELCDEKLHTHTHEIIDDFEDNYYRNFKLFFGKLVNDGVVKNDGVYDLYNTDFVDSVNNRKFKFSNCILDDEAKSPKFRKPFIEKLFFCDTIVNGYLNANFPCFKCFKPEQEEEKGDDDNNEIVLRAHDEDEYIYFSKLKDGNYYDQRYLRKYIPYCVELYDASQEVYLLNRKYEYIDEESSSPQKKTNHMNFQSWNDATRVYLFNDGSRPFHGNRQAFETYINKFDSLLASRPAHTIVNLTRQTSNLLDL